MIELLKQAHGLLSDTRALFALLRLTAADPTLNSAARRLLKLARGVLAGWPPPT